MLSSVFYGSKFLIICFVHCRLALSDFAQLNRVMSRLEMTKCIDMSIVNYSGLLLLCNVTQNPAYYVKKGIQIAVNVSKCKYSGIELCLNIRHCSTVVFCFNCRYQPHASTVLQTWGLEAPWVPMTGGTPKKTKQISVFYSPRASSLGRNPLTGAAFSRYRMDCTDSNISIMKSLHIYRHCVLKRKQNQANIP